MPAAGGLKKSELYIDTPVKRPRVITGNPLEPFLRPFSPIVKVGSYVALWKNPPLSAYTFIWCNLCILLHIAFGVTTLLTTTITLLLLTTNLIMAEYSFTKTNVTVLLLYSLVGVPDVDLSTLPGSAELSQVLVNGVNSLCNVFLNIRDSSRQGQAQFYFALCTTVAMLTIILTYFATSTTLLLLFWFSFCFPAIKHNQLHRKITQEQIGSVFNMSLYMLYSIYQAVVLTLSATPDVQGITPQTQGEDNLEEESLALSDPATSPRSRSTTMTYLRGLPSAMTLRWGDGLTSWFSRGKPPTNQSPSAISPSQRTTSTESDSDFGIDDIEDDGVRPPAKTRSLTVDTLGSNADLEFPSIERKDTLDLEGTLTLAEGLDPQLLYDEDRTFTLDTTGGSGSEFTLGGAQRMHLLDAVTESGDEEESDAETDVKSRGTELSPTPEYGAVIRSTDMSRDDPLDGHQFMLPTPPAEPKSTATSSHHRVKQSSEQSTATTDTEFYVISDEDIRAVTDEMEESISSNASGTSNASGASGTSLRQRITGRIKQMSGGNQNPRI